MSIQKTSAEAHAKAAGVPYLNLNEVPESEREAALGGVLKAGAEHAANRHRASEAGRRLAERAVEALMNAHRKINAANLGRQCIRSGANDRETLAAVKWQFPKGRPNLGHIRQWRQEAEMQADLPDPSKPRLNGVGLSYLPRHSADMGNPPRMLGVKVAPLLSEDKPAEVPGALYSLRSDPLHRTFKTPDEAIAAREAQIGEEAEAEADRLQMVAEAKAAPARRLSIANEMLQVVTTVLLDHATCAAEWDIEHSGLCDEHARDAALTEAKACGALLGEIAVALRFATED